MKKLIAIMTAVLLVIASAVPALAATKIENIGGVTPQPLTGPSAVDPGGISLKIPADMFDSYVDSDINALTAGLTGVTVNGSPVATPADLMTINSPQFVVGDGTSPVMNVTLLPAAQKEAAQTIVATFTFRFTGNPETPDVYTTATGTWTATINAKPAPPPAPGTVLGLKVGPITAGSGVTGVAGTAINESIPVAATQFLNTQGNATPNNDQLNAAALSFSADNGYSVSYEGGALKLSNSNPSALNGYIAVTVTMGLNSMLINVPANVTEPPLPPTTITGVAFNSEANLDFTPSPASIDNGKNAMAASVSAIIPMSDFNITTDNDNYTVTVDQLVTWLNANKTGAGLVSPSFAKSGSDSVVLTGSLPAGTHASLSAGVAVGGVTRRASYTNLTVYSGAGAYMGLKTSSLNATTSPSSLKVGDTLLFEISSSQNAFFAGTAPADFASVLKANTKINGLSSLFAYDFVSQNAKTYLKLTAQNPGSVSGSFTLTDSVAAPTLQTVTLQLPSATINAQNSANNKITGIASGASLGDDYTVNGKAVSEYIDDLEVKPGDVIRLEFDTDFFTWEGAKPSPATGVTSSQLSTGRITMKAVSKQGPIDDVRIVRENNKSYIEITIDDSVNTAKEVKFSVEVGFSHSGKYHTDSRARVKGVVKEDAYEIYDDDDYVDMTDNPVIEAVDSIRNGSFYIGDGMTILASLTKGRTYYAKSDGEYTNRDEQIFDKYSEIVDVYHIDYSGFSASSKVEFDTDERLYVYDYDGNYLGTTNDRLPLEKTYYLATKRINFGVSSGGSSGGVSEKPSTSSPSGSGGGGSSSGGTGKPGGYNPNTGR